MNHLNNPNQNVSCSESAELKLPACYLVTDSNTGRKVLPSDPREVNEIIRTVNMLQDKAFFACHMAMRQEIESGLAAPYPEWEEELTRADEIVKKYGIENLEPLSEGQWWMLIGKVTALRWVLGCEWEPIIV